MARFGPIGDSDIISLTSSSQAFALGTLAATNPAIRLISLNAQHQAWFVKFGTSGAVTVSTTDGMRLEPAADRSPALLPVPAGSTHIAILADSGSAGDAQISYGGFDEGEFEIGGASTTVTATQTDQRIALPTMGASQPAIRLVAAASSMQSLWIKLGDNTVTGDRATSMRIPPGSVSDPVIVPVVDGQTHLSIFSEGVGGAVVVTGGSLVGLTVPPVEPAAAAGSFEWTFDSSTTMADPGAGDFRLNNATLASVTAAAIDDQSAESGNPDVSPWVLAWDDLASTVRGTIIIKKIEAPENFAVYNITGASTDNAGWTQLALTHVVSNGSFSASDACSIAFVRGYADGGDFPKGHIWGLIYANNATDANNDIDVGAGQCRSDDNTANMVLSASITKRLDAAWAVGTNQGGLDTGSEAANTWYYVWLIKRPDTGVVDVLFSTSATSPTMPTNYTLKRRIGCIRNNASSNIIAFTQSATHPEIITYTTSILDVNVTNLSTTRTNYTLTVPPSMMARFRGLISTLSSGSQRNIVIQPTSETNAAPSASAVPLITLAAGSTDLITTASHFEMLVDGSSQIAARASGATTEFRVATLGWRDTRGMLNT